MYVLYDAFSCVRDCFFLGAPELINIQMGVMISGWLRSATNVSMLIT